MRIKLKYPDLETFIQKYAVNISRGGIFIATKSPKPVGTAVKFEFMLANAESTSLIRGEGLVQWTREFDPAMPTKAHGMGVKFTRLDAGSQEVVERALSWRASHGLYKKGDSEGLTVATTAPPGATPEPTPIAPRNSEDEPTQVSATVPEPSPPPRVVAPPTARPVRDDPTILEPPRGGRSPEEFTRPVAIEAAVDEQRQGDRETREIELPDSPPRDGVTGETALPDDSVRIALKRHRQRNGQNRGEELDAMAAEWGLSEERLERVLRRKRPRMVEATAELERLLRKPPKPAVPSSVQEAIRLLTELLARKPPGEPAQTQAAGGEPDPADDARSKRSKRAR